MKLWVKHQAIEMDNTFKNVANMIVEMAGVEFKDQEWQVDVDIQKIFGHN